MAMRCRHTTRLILSPIIVVIAYLWVLLPATATETAAEYAILLDFDTGATLLEKNADHPTAPASMSKLMTLYMVFERLKSGILRLEDTFPVSEKAWRMGGSKMFVGVNTRVKLEDLLRGIVVQSGNDACIVVAEGLAQHEAAFAEEMTERAREIGLTNSTFTNSTGWPDPDHLMSVRDIATLSTIVIREFPDLYSMFAEKSFTYNDIKQSNRNPLLYRYDGADGLKTGHTEASGYGLAASVSKRGRRLLLVVNGLDSPKATGPGDREAVGLGVSGIRQLCPVQCRRNGRKRGYLARTGGSGSTRHRNRRNPDPAAQVSAQDGG